MQKTIVTSGLDELGLVFLNRFTNKIKITSIFAKDYGVNYDPVKIFDVNSNTKKFSLQRTQLASIINSADDEDQRKWFSSVQKGTFKALYRANLNFFKEDFLENDIPNEQDILWDSYAEREIAIIPDTSALLDGFITRLIECEDFDDDDRTDLFFYLTPTVIEELQNHATGRQFQLKSNGKNNEKTLIIVPN